MGLDIERLCNETRRMMRSCDSCVPPAANPGARLGIALGVLATKFGRDKITIATSAPVASIGAWLEQLIAESTGKQGKGLIPVDGEDLADPDVYGKDRVFIHVHLAGVDDPSDKLAALEQAGHPVIRIAISDSYQIGQLFFVLEVAIAMAGAMIGINPFDQPDVEAAKVRARDMTKQLEQGGEAGPKPVFATDGVGLFAETASGDPSLRANTLAQYMKGHLARIAADDYFALLAYVPRTREHEQLLHEIRMQVRDRKHVATCLGFGPRYLHSTGQAYKGGPATGVFLEITCDHQDDLQVPNRNITFGNVQLAQALGDLAVLNERGRPAMRVHLKDLKSGFASLRQAIEEALH
jgi:transaldolase/glucose-6-phosphate isomerase